MTPNNSGNHHMTPMPPPIDLEIRFLVEILMKDYGVDQNLEILRVLCNIMKERGLKCERSLALEYIRWRCNQK